MLLFVSYRREDSAAATGRIDDRLRQEFGKEAVFRDIESIPIGSDFVEHIETAVARCDALIVVIGARWLSSRLEAPHDFVRLEIEAAFKRGVPVVPLLVDGARMPSVEQLPPGLAPLARRNALEVHSGRDFSHHFSMLVEGLKRMQQGGATASSSAPPTIARRSLLPSGSSRSKALLLVGAAALMVAAPWAVHALHGGGASAAGSTTAISTRINTPPPPPLPMAWLEPSVDPTVWGYGNFTCLPVKLTANDQTSLTLRLSNDETADVQLSLAWAPELCHSPECNVLGGCPALGIGDQSRVALLAARLSRREVGALATLLFRGTPLVGLDLSKHGSIAQAMTAPR